MRDRKLYDLLRRLSPEERALFVEFLRSPLHAHRPKLGDMVALMEELLFAAPDRPCSSEDFYAAFYPGKPYDSNNLNRLISVITTEFKEFLALRFFQRDRTARTACATREMSRRRWEDILPKEIALTRKALQEELPDDEHNYYQLYCLEYENARHAAENTGTRNTLIYQPLLNAADKYFLLVKRKLQTYSHMYDVRHKTKHIIRWAEVFNDPQALELEGPSVSSKLFTTASTLIINSTDKETFFSFNGLLEKNLPYYDEHHQPLGNGRISKVDAESLLGIGQNAVIAISRVEEGFQQTQNIRLVKTGIERGILLEEGFLNAKFFETFIKTTAVAGQISEAWEFLNNNSKLLKEKDQTVSPQFCTGLLHVYEMNPEKALRVLLKLKSQFNQNIPPHTQLETRILLCLAWFRLGETESLLHEVNAMRTYLGRLTSISKQSLLTYERFLKAISSVENAERKSIDRRLVRYKKILWDLEFKPRFIGIGLLKRDIIHKYGTELEYWRQEHPGANS
jgi:hypothetical protein